ncbi:MAG: CPBP family intramembrane metalloprotease [bacterium]|nr:CPBP family intramembrane metalloprotease [bacterium]
MSPALPSNSRTPRRWGIASSGAGRRPHPALLIALILIFLAPYIFRIPWRFAWASALLLVCALAALRGGGLELLGLRAPPLQIAAALVPGVAVWWCASLVLVRLSARHNFSFVPFDSIELLIGKPLFQSLNEEMILRALLLGLLLAWRPAARHWMGGQRAWVLMTATVAALIFSGLHWIFYNWLSDVGLRPGTLLSLFFVGFALNAFYLRSGHIYFGIAIHAGWNLVRFGGRFYSGDSLEYIRYAHTFNLLEGDPAVIAASCGMALLGVVLLWRAPLPTDAPPAAISDETRRS